MIEETRTTEPQNIEYPTAECRSFRISIQTSSLSYSINPTVAGADENDA